MNYVLSIIKFIFLFFCLMELTVCVKWDKLFDPMTTINTWDDVALPPGMCWASLPPFAGLCLFLAILVSLYHFVSLPFFVVYVSLS